MTTFHVTFGQRYRHEPHPVLGWIPDAVDGWITIEADNIETARRLVHSTIGHSWSDVYREEPWPGGRTVGTLQQIIERANRQRETVKDSR